MAYVMMSSSILLYLLCLSLLTIHFGVCREIECIESERETLMKLKNDLIDHSNRLSSWNLTLFPNCCLWPGVVCNNITSHVAELHLNTSPTNFDSMFGGEINPCLVDLKHLNYLNFSGNDFGVKPIPSFLGNMTSLTHLDLSDAGFHGEIPSQIGNLTNLVYLDLSYFVNGTIPSQIGNLSNLIYLRLQSDFFYFYLQSNSLFSENVEWLSSMSKLEYLDLGGVNLSKSLNWLNTMQALPSLMHLSLSGCTLPVHYNQPSSLNFSSLLTLHMSSVYFPFVPKWIFGLNKLVSLQLFENFFQSPIPDGIQNLTLLENLDLSYNSLSSSIPHWLYGLLHLRFLNLQGNNLNGTISEALGNLTSLVQLDLSHNKLEGTIPTSVGNLISLVQLCLSDNQLQATTPISLENLTSLVELDLSFNHFEGKFGVFNNIAELDFSVNWIGKLSSLTDLDLSNNRFNGNPFEIIGSLSELSYLKISHNNFEGVIKEDDLVNLTRLSMFVAAGNNFTLKVSPDWLPTFQLTTLDMTAWQLGPNFPSWIQLQNNLRYLEMSYTGISVSIPTWFWEAFPQAYYLNLSHNHINGELSKSLSNLTSLEYIDFSSNQLHGKLPHLSYGVTWLDLSSNYFSESMTDFLCNKKFKRFELQFLNLASNNLSGKIPDCWRKWPNLIDVNMQSNHLVGNLPPSMGSLAWLQSLNMRNNSLSGKFPSILKNNTGLISLDLGENYLSGNIPTWIAKRLQMIILRLRSNNFSGHIPNEICDMNILQDLDLAQNSLSGNIPSCFNHLFAMLQKKKSTDLFIYSIVFNDGEVDDKISIRMWIKGRVVQYTNILGLVTNIDLSDNNLSGVIPREITNLDGLIYLNLSKNQLSGQIPSSIGNMRSLESIDISRNQLSGEIPSTITNLSFLNMLDVSYNHLRGKIPTGTQMQTFEASNFVGNNLCGPPLPINWSSSQQIPHIDQIGMENDGHGVNWFFVSMALGFIMGFWAVVGPLFIYRSWRYAYFCFLEDMWYKLLSYW